MNMLIPDYFLGVVMHQYQYKAMLHARPAMHL